MLHVVSYFPPDRMGGVGEVVAHVHRALIAAGHRSVVLTTGGSKDEPGIVRCAGSPVRLALGCLRHVALARKADVVHMHHGESLALLVAMRVLRIGTPTLLTLHVNLAALRRSLAPYAVEGVRLGRGGLRRWLYRTVLVRVRDWLDHGAMALADRVTFISKSVATDVLPSAQRAAAPVIYNGLPDAVLAPSPIGPPSPQPVELLFVGANSVRKRVEMLPFVVRQVRAQRPDARLRIIGFERDENPELLRRARELGVLDAIVFEGRKRSDELPPYYRAARVLLVPSSYEGLPMVILEAFQAGLPCVATRVSGHPEVIDDGDSGFLVDLDRPDQMAAAALRIIGDPALGRRMGANGLARVAARFHVDRQAAEYLGLYQELRAESGRGGRSQ